MATENKSYRRTSLKMTNTEKRELLRRLKKSKTVEEDEKIRKEFYKEYNLVRPTMLDRWESDAEKYENEPN